MAAVLAAPPPPPHPAKRTVVAVTTASGNFTNHILEMLMAIFLVARLIKPPLNKLRVVIASPGFGETLSHTPTYGTGGERTELQIKPGGIASLFGNEHAAARRLDDGQCHAYSPLAGKRTPAGAGFVICAIAYAA